MNEYLNKNSPNFVHHLSCQALRHTAYLTFWSGRMLKALLLAAGLMALASKVQALSVGSSALWFWTWLDYVS